MSPHSTLLAGRSLIELIPILDLLPPHNPGRVEALDGYEDPNCSNAKRSGFAAASLAIYGQKCHIDEEVDVLVSDLISDALHLVHSRGFSPKDVLEKAIANFIAEAG